jgi:hypothetical protein
MNEHSRGDDQRGRQKPSSASPRSQTHNQGNSGDSGNKENGRKEKRGGTFRRRWRATSLPNKLMIVATIVIAGATAINVVVSVKQWSVANESLELLRTQQRPWVGVVSVNLGNVLPPSKPSWNVTFKNFGPMPAPSTRIHSGYLLTRSFESVKELLKTMTPGTISTPTLPGQEHPQFEWVSKN